MRTVLLILMSIAIIACGPTDPTGAGGGAGDASLTGAGGAAQGGTGGAPSGWTAGLDHCDLGAPVKGEAVPYTGVFQVIRPSGHHVTTLHVGVWQSLPGEELQGPPWGIVWAVGPDAPVGQVTFPSAPAISGDVSVEAADVLVQDNPHVGIATIPVDLTVADGEALMVLQRLSRPGDVPANVLLCTSPTTGGLDSYAVKGACPGVDCETVLGPVPSEPAEAIWAWAEGD